MSPPEDPAAPVRIDRWLWAARLAKTRALAADAVKGGRVHVNGHAVKPSRELKPGDRVEVTTGPVPVTVDVRATSARRVPAAQAAELYAETAESRERRERHAEQRRLAGPDPLAHGPRPTKRDRRRLEDARGRRR